MNGLQIHLAFLAARPALAINDVNRLIEVVAGFQTGKVTTLASPSIISGNTW